jgi:hypothetical protein
MIDSLLPSARCEDMENEKAEFIRLNKNKAAGDKIDS